MKKILLAAMIVVGVSVLSHAIELQASRTFNNDSRQVTLGTSTVTQIMTEDPFITRSYIVNSSTWQSVCISTYAATVAVSTTTSPFVPPNTVFTLGDSVSPWWGQLWATMCNSQGTVGSVTGSTQTISVIRTK